MEACTALPHGFCASLALQVLQINSNDTDVNNGVVTRTVANVSCSWLPRVTVAGGCDQSPGALGMVSCINAYPALLHPQAMNDVFQLTDYGLRPSSWRCGGGCCAKPLK